MLNREVQISTVVHHRLLDNVQSNCYAFGAKMLFLYNRCNWQLWNSLYGHCVKLCCQVGTKCEARAIMH